MKDDNQEQDLEHRQIEWEFTITFPLTVVGREDLKEQTIEQKRGSLEVAETNIKDLLNSLGYGVVEVDGRPEGWEEELWEKFLQSEPK